MIFDRVMIVLVHCFLLEDVPFEEAGFLVCLGDVRLLLRRR
jgi:hypothetical protein